MNNYKKIILLLLFIHIYINKAITRITGKTNTIKP